jgi:hypothetical protein
MTIGHIYRIIHLESDLQYVGSTFNEPRKRWQQHKKDYSKWISGNTSTISIYPDIHDNGIDKFKLIDIKSYDVVDRKQLEAYEQLWINKLKCVNKNNPLSLHCLFKKQYMELYDQNRTRPANYTANNTCPCGGKYQTCSKALHFRSERHLQWVRNGVANKGSVSVKTQCQCGGQFVKKHKGAHQRSQKHQQWLSQNR